MLNAMQELGLLSSGEAGVIGKVLDLANIAEEEVEKAMTANPKHRQALWNSFSLLRPGGWFSNVGVTMYRKHCQELLSRVIDGEDTRPATKAQLLVALVEVSLQAPLNDTGQYLYTSLFDFLFGDDEAVPDHIKTPIREALGHKAALGHDWNAETEFQRLRKKYQDKNRVLKPQEDWKDIPSRLGG